MFCVSGLAQKASSRFVDLRCLSSAPRFQSFQKILHLGYVFTTQTPYLCGFKTCTRKSHGSLLPLSSISITQQPHISAVKTAPRAYSVAVSTNTSKLHLGFCHVSRICSKPLELSVVAFGRSNATSTHIQTVVAQCDVSAFVAALKHLHFSGLTL